MKNIGRMGIWSTLAASAAILLAACGADPVEGDPDEDEALGKAMGAFSGFGADACVSGCANGAPNGTCEPAESAFNCAQDCACGDGHCDGTETPLTCPVDCQFGPDDNLTGNDFCGNGRCDRWEVDVNGILCPQDCKLGAEPAGTSCGDYSCDPGETSASCPADCGNKALCGDGICDVNVAESYGTCPVDCPSPHLLAGRFEGTYCDGPNLMAKYSDGYGGTTSHLVTPLAGGCNKSYPWRLLTNAGTCQGSTLQKPDGTACTIQTTDCQNGIDGKFTLGGTYTMSQDASKCGSHTYATAAGTFQPVEWKKLGTVTCTVQAPCTMYDCTGQTVLKTSGPASQWTPHVGRWSQYAGSCQ